MRILPAILRASKRTKVSQVSSRDLPVLRARALGIQHNAVTYQEGKHSREALGCTPETHRAMDWQPTNDADVLSFDTSDERAAYFAGHSGGCMAVHSGVPWSQVKHIMSSPSSDDSSLPASPIARAAAAPLPVPLPAPLPWIPQARGVDDHLPCAVRRCL